jgi:hypothetical protein
MMTRDVAGFIKRNRKKKVSLVHPCPAYKLAILNGIKKLSVGSRHFKFFLQRKMILRSRLQMVHLGGDDLMDGS